MVVSDLRIIGQIGTTIGLGLLFDTLIVRSFMTPSIAALLGRWFWWPQIVRPRPASSLLEPVGTRASVRVLLGQHQAGEGAGSRPFGDNDDDAPTRPLSLAGLGYHERALTPKPLAIARRRLDADE